MANDGGASVCFVTNGGGGDSEEAYMKKTTSKIVKAAVEAAKASGLEQLIEETDAAHDPLAWLTGDRMILSYTPMDDDQSMKDQRILLIGDPKEKVKAMAVQYGWTNAVHVSDYCEANPLVDPFGAARAGDPSKEIVVEPTSGHGFGRKGSLSTTGVDVDGDNAAAAAPSSSGPNHGYIGPIVAAPPPKFSQRPRSGSNATEEQPFDTVVVMTDPHDWFEALQAAVDVVCAANPNSEGVLEFDLGRCIPIHFSNPDIFWKAEHPQPRFGQGAFRIAFEGLFRARLSMMKVPPSLVDSVLRECIVQWGKPSQLTRSCCERRLSVNGTVPPSMWMVGDNPGSDMAIAAMGGKRWRGVLVRTGVYEDSDVTCGAEAVVNRVSDAVAYILGVEEREQAEREAEGC
mmetsp:Transcript_96770/g.276410  ORF Transcript_96770/g.276410 Transcript_96770/m.276410 type:complete len:401 (-) Transcript_96770:812-2014(-)